MAHFKTIITDAGADVFTHLMSSGNPLVLHKAMVGDGVSSGDNSKLTALVNQRPVDVALGERTFEEGPPSYMTIPIQVTNAGLAAPVYVREMGLFCLGESGEDVLFSYSSLEGGDSDNVLPATTLGAKSDTIHLHDVTIIATNQVNANVTLVLSQTATVTRAQLMEYAAPIGHMQSAETIMETVGKTVEANQRRQDYEIQALQEQLDCGFSGTTAQHTFEAGQLEKWAGYSGTGLPEGVWESGANRLYL